MCKRSVCVTLPDTHGGDLSTTSLVTSFRAWPFNKPTCTKTITSYCVHITQCGNETHFLNIWKSWSKAFERGEKENNTNKTEKAFSLFLKRVIWFTQNRLRIFLWKKTYMSVLPLCILHKRLKHISKMFQDYTFLFLHWEGHTADISQIYEDENHLIIRNKPL